ncbi:leucine--tRNA ligase [Candidatus Peregrinibacteria bacterium]|nr:leucine--tRNA ligase [Candidatus Peregrinibacteria bacterium]
MRIVHLVFTPHNREAAFDSSKDAMSILRILDVVASRHDIVIHEAAAMPDHVHLLVSFHRDRDLNQDIVKKLKGASAREFLKNTGGGSLWGEGVHHENVDTQQNFDAVIHYIRNNPPKDSIPVDGRVLSSLPLTITCFTTRPDTNFGATFIVLAPEHPFVQKVMSGGLIPKDKSSAKQVRDYHAFALAKTELQRQEEGRKKTGAFTGFYAMNNLNGARIPIWISDFVLAGFGTGAVVGVPGHDRRDFEFARQFGIPIVRVVVGSDGDTSPVTRIEQVQEEEGAMVHSGFLDGFPIMEAKEKIMDHLEKEGWGKRVTTYRLRDWLVSRQRYWGAPIPIVYDPQGNPHPIPDEHLPWLLPTDVEFKPTGESPLRHSREFIERTEKIFGKGWRPEFDTMDTFVCSSFYYLRYLAASVSSSPPALSVVEGIGGRRGWRGQGEGVLVDPFIEKKWMPVSMYIGGPEHACMHLIYARFVMMALKDFGFVAHEEPFKKLVHQGLITNKGAKMSKSKGNVVSPDSFVDRHGSDVFRMYLMFMGPFTNGGDWSDSGIKGIDRFVQRVWRTFGEEAKEVEEAGDAKEVIVALNQAIKKVTESLEKMHFNTAISALMEFMNAVEGESFSNETAKTFTRLLAPLAPHLAEELWETLNDRKELVPQSPASSKVFGSAGFVIDQRWPEFDPRLLVTATMTIVVQVNGKVRGQIDVAADASEKDILAMAKKDLNVQKFLAKKSVKKELYVKGKLVSIVV